MGAETQLAVDAAARDEVVAGLIAKLERYYLFPEVAGRMAAHIQGRREAGAYDAIDDPLALCDALTEDMQEISNDKHLRLRFSPDARPAYVEEDISDNPERREEYRQEAARRNFGFRRVEVLPGNIGYIEQVLLDEHWVAAETAVAAMQLVANTHALILDLRRNGGGDPYLVALLCSYLLPGGPVHLNSFYDRESGRSEQFWTLPHVPGRRYGDNPVYVLTSRKTASGAEELAYDLQQLKRATLIGETTAGAAHPVGLYQITPHFEAFISVGRAVNPITGTNWEVVGVVPDIVVPAEEALATAHRLALEHVLTTLDRYLPAPRRALDREAREALAGYGGMGNGEWGMGET